MAKVPVGVIQGRFQIIHKGHMEYFLAAKQRADFLIIGISDPDPTRTYIQPEYPLLDNESYFEPQRTLKDPFYTFTFYERMLMITESVKEAGVRCEEFAIVPFPVHFPMLLKYYVPTDAVFFVTVYDAWGREKLKLFERMGIRYEILWERDLSERFTTGSEVRRLIAEGGEWEALVPPAVERIIKTLELDKKLRLLSRS